MVEFYKKNKWTTFAELNSTYKDLYDSVGATMVGRTLTVDGSSGTNSTYGFGSIRGGPAHKKAFFKTQVAERPTYGSGKLKRMDNYMWIEDLVMEENSVTTPNLVMYKCKPDVVDFTGTGHIKLSQTTGRTPGHLFSISSNMDRYVSDQENFTGTVNKFSYEGKEEVIPIARSLVSVSKPYLEREDMYEYGRVNMNRHGGFAIKDTARGIDYYSRKHTSYTEHSGSNADAGRRKVCYIKRHNDNLWKSVKNDSGSDTLFFINNAIQNIIVGTKEHVIQSDADYNNQVTTENTFFDVVKHDKEVMMDGQDDKTNLVGTGVSRFSTKAPLKNNGQSMQMYTFWAGNSTIDDAPQNSHFTKRAEFYTPNSNPNASKYSPTQETFVSYGPVPFPATVFPAWVQNVSYDGITDTVSSSTENSSLMGAGQIEIDVNMDRLETAVCYHDTNTKISLVRRAWVVTLGMWKPSPSDTLMSYMGKHFTNDTSPGVINQWSSASDNDVLNAIDTTNAYPFLGWSFFRTAGIEKLVSDTVGDFGTGTGDDWADGIHMVPLHGDNAKINTDSGLSKFEGTNHDVFILATEDSEDDDNPTCNEPLPIDGAYMTMKIKFPRPGDPINDHKVEVDLCDPTTGKPLMRVKDNEAEPQESSEVSSTSHYTGARMALPMWWTGKTANAGSQSNGRAGLMFPMNSDADNGGVNYFASDHSSPTAANYGGGPEQKGAVWPRYLTCWLTNFPNCTDETTEDIMLENSDGEELITVNDPDASGTTSDHIRRPTESSVLVDGIRLVNFNYDHSNATEAFGEYNANGIDIPSSSTNEVLNFNATPVINDGLGVPGFSAVSFGTERLEDFLDGTSADVGIFLNNFQTNLANNVAVKNVRWGISTAFNADAYETSSTTLGTNTISDNGTDGGSSFFGNQTQYSAIGGKATDHSKTFTLDTDISQTNAIGYESGTGNVDGFTRAGFIQIKGSIATAGTGVGRNQALSTNTNPVPTLQKRENILCSARVLRVVDRQAGVYKVDTTEIFKGAAKDTFIAYLWGGANRSTGNTVATTDTEGGDGNVSNATIKLISILDDRHVQLEWNGLSSTNENMSTNHQLPYLFISPYKVWLYGIIQNWDIDSEDGNFATAFPPKKYSSALCTIGDGTSNNHYGAAFGATFNEFLYNDAPTITGSYENRWYHSPEDENTILDLRDFGFGEYSTDTETGGFLSKNIPKTRQYNQFKMDKIFEVDSTLQPGDDIHFVVDSLNPNSKHEAVYYNNLESAPSGVSLNSNQTSRLPYSLTVFEDDLPSTPTLKVKPYENDPYLPEYTFTADDDDLWYGILIVDDKPVNSQYHDAILHLPLNETGSHGATASAPRNKAFYNNSDAVATSETGGMSISGPVHDIEGLTGCCLRFDGNDKVEYDDSDGTTLADLTTNASWVVHFIPDTDNTGVSGIIDSAQCDIEFNGTDQSVPASIKATVYHDSSESVTLSSPSITFDGETPTSVIVTFDNTLKHGNVKLFVNGKLADQSGLLKSTAMSDGDTNWRTGENLRASGNAFRVGRTSSGFKGRIEEVVVYKSTIYPVVPSDESFVLTKPLEELFEGASKSYSARLFMKDYHNIRGGSATEVATSPTVSFRKAAFRLED